MVVKNSSCPCGSGRKYKRCCLPKENLPLSSSDSPAEKHREWFSFYLIIILAFVGLIIYSNTFGNPFTFDDAIMEKERNLAYLEAMAATNGKAGPLDMIAAFTNLTRPVALISFYINYLAGGENPRGYHLVNLTIHILTAIVVYWLILFSLYRSRYFKDQEDPGKAKIDLAQQVAAVTALLFLSHPVQTQAVTYIVQRETSLMALFYLLALLAYHKGRTSRESVRKYLFYLGAAGSALLSFGTKQNAVTLPVFIILYEVYFFQDLDWQQIKSKITLYIPLLASPVLIALVYTRFDFFAKMAQAYKERPFTMGQRLITEMRVILHYLTLLIFPHPGRLNLDYDFPFSLTLVSPNSTLTALTVVSGLIGIAYYLRKKRPIISFGIFWFFGHLVVESTIYPLDLVYEHRLYLPSVGFFWLIAIGLNKITGRISREHRSKSLSVIVTGLIILLGWGTYQRNRVWGSEIDLWQDVVSKSSKKARPHNNLGKAYAAAALADKSLAHLADKAIVEYKKAIELNPRNFVAYDNLGQSYGRKGKTEEAIKACKEAVKLNPNYLQARNNLGVAYNKLGKYDLAIKACKEAIRIMPNYAKAYFNLGKGQEGKKEYGKAIVAFRKAWSLRPKDANIPYNLGNVYHVKGEPAKATRFYLRSLQIDPGFVDAYYNLGVVYFNQAKYRESVRQFQEIIRRAPSHAPAYERLGLLYMDKLKNRKLALNYFKKAVKFYKTEKEAWLANNMIKKMESK